MHPELFELKALIAGRLDGHRRREIDDHLGACADCSRHYVALMLGSASPKTAEAEARQALVPTGGAMLSLVGGGGAASSYGIDAPIAPSPRAPAPRVAPPETAALETESPAPASLVDAISRLRAESQGKPVAAAPTAPVVQVVAAPAPVADLPLLAPSIFTPTPIDGISVIHPSAPVSHAPSPELVVTFSSTPSRTPSQRSSSPVSAPVVPASVTPSQEYVSQAVPTLASVPASNFELAAPAAAAPRGTKKPSMRGGAVAAAVLALVVAVAGYKFFQSSVSEAASAAAAAATKQVEAAARTTKPAAAPAPAPVQTRIVYVEKPSSRREERAQAKPETVTVAPAVPIAVTLPDVNLNTGADAAAQSSTQRSAATELTRSARATAIRTAAPRP